MKRLYSYRYALAFIAGIFYFLEVAVGQYSNKVITYSGQYAPGTDSAVFDNFYAFEALGVSRDGTILFSANLKSNVGDTEYGINEWGVWKFEEDSLKLVARKGGPVPGVPGKIFLNDRNPEVFMDYETGLTAIDAIYSNSGNNDTTTHVFMKEQPNGTYKTVLEPYTVLDFETDIISFEVYSFNGGYVLFSCNLVGDNTNGSNNSALCVLDEADNVNPLVRKGDDMHEIGNDFIINNYYSYNSTNPILSNGFTMFDVEGIRAVPSAKIGAVYTWSPAEGLNLFDASGIDSTLLVFADYRMNEYFDIAGLGWNQYPSSRKIWYSDTSMAYRFDVVSEGDTAVGLSPQTFDHIQEFVIQYDRISFTAETDNGTEGIWTFHDDTLRLVAAVGDSVVDVPGYWFYRVNNMVANASGQIAFSDLIVNDAKPGQDLVGLWIGGYKGLSKIAITNDTLALTDSGDVKKVIEGVSTGNTVELRTGTDGFSSTLNDAGRLLYSANFKDGTSALVLAVPSIVVNSTGDEIDYNPGDGICDTGGPLVEGKPECTLRAALQEANAKPGKDDITFNIPGGNQKETIIVGTSLPAVEGPTLIDATTQWPGLVELDGTNTGSETNGFTVLSAGTTIKGFAIYNFGNHGILLDSMKFETEPTSSEDSMIIIESNYIGLDVFNDVAKPNGGDGIYVNAHCKKNAIIDNHISGNALNGIFLSGLGYDGMEKNAIEDNYIGTSFLGHKAVGNGEHGIYVEKLHNTQILHNIVSGNMLSGIFIEDVDSVGNIIDDNLIGTEINGKTRLPNKEHGISIHNSKETKIGTEVGNLVSGNGKSGIYIVGGDTLGASIIKNFIGTDVTGKDTIRNIEYGIYIEASGNNKIGNDSLGNVISGNNESGIYIKGTASKNSSIKNNVVGLNIDENKILPNDEGIILSSTRFISIENNNISGNRFEGIAIGESENITITRNFIGTNQYFEKLKNEEAGIYISEGIDIRVGGDPEDGNYIVFNGESGIELTGESEDINIRHNRIDYNDDGINCEDALNVSIEDNIIANNKFAGVNIAEPSHFIHIHANAIYENEKLGIDIEPNGVTPNDNNDTDNGGNKEINYPEITVAEYTGDLIIIQGFYEGEYDSISKAPIAIGFYFNQVCDESGYGEGKYYLTSDTLTLTDTSKYSFSFELPVTAFADIPFYPGGFITATATQAYGEYTSEFSQCKQLKVQNLKADLWVMVEDSVVATSGNNYEVHYTITFGNNGNDDAENVLLSIDLPDSVTFVSDESSITDSIINEGNIRNYFIPSLAKGIMDEIIIHASFDTSASNLVSTINISSGMVDEVIDNNTAIDTISLENVDPPVLSIHENISSLYHLGQNIPNPFSNTTIIPFNIPGKERVTLEIYDVNGRKVKTICNNKVFLSGKHQIEVSLNNLASGIYYYRFETGVYMKVEKMIYINQQEKF